MYLKDDCASNPMSFPTKTLEYLQCGQTMPLDSDSNCSATTAMLRMSKDVTIIKHKVKRRDILEFILVAIILSLLTALVVTLVVLCQTSRTIEDQVSVPCQLEHRSFAKDEYIRSPIHSFTELKAEEVKTIIDYLMKQESLGLSSLETAEINSNFIHSVELKLAPKHEVLENLDNGGPLPARQAKVYIFMGNATPPLVEEYVVGNLPNISFHQLAQNRARKTQIPYTIRPFSLYEFKGIYRYILPPVARRANKLLNESYGATLLDCTDKCLRFSMTPVSSAFIGEGERKAWFWLAYDKEFFTLLPLDFQFLVDMTDVHPNNWTIQQVWYANTLFPSLEDLLQKYEHNQINTTRVSYPSCDEKDLYSSLHLRGPTFPSEDLHMPRHFQPNGPRYKVRGNQVDYMMWRMNFRMSPTVGIQLFDIRYQGERVLYELSMQEIAVLYSGHSPASSMLYFADSAGLYGTRSRGLLPGIDCPDYATFQDIELFTSNEGGMRKFENALCIFEQNTQLPLRRHRAYSRSGAFYNGLLDSVLVIRIVISVINYDYVYDFTFHNNGAVHVRVVSTGYLTTSFFSPEEARYGTRVNDNVVAGMHHHLFNFKADVDVKGVSNRHQTFNIEMENKTNEWSDGGNSKHTQLYFSKHIKQTEKEATFRYDFEKPQYLLFSNADKTDQYGNQNSYRMMLHGMTKQNLPSWDGFESSVTWSRYQMAVTKHRDEEETSSSMFAMWDARDPVVNFQNYIDDDENIVDEDLVAWVTLGTYHIPQTENVPNTATTGGHLSFLLAPFNYFKEDPSMGSRDAVRVTPMDKKNPYSGAVVERYGLKGTSECSPPELLPDDLLQKNSSSLFA
ncbi:putative amine oxidase [copper-containing] [Haliotis cracherodii]|uniref:putative amine oxidase [copper-containing] n=1 Tax=Haliotis cracherodii TaxID=6455 RepID=UPI0039EBCD6D